MKQSNKQCKCGSWYINEGKCNGCAEPVYVPDSFYMNKEKLIAHIGRMQKECYGRKRKGRNDNTHTRN